MNEYRNKVFWIPYTSDWNKFGAIYDVVSRGDEWKTSWIQWYEYIKESLIVNVAWAIISPKRTLTVMM